VRYVVTLRSKAARDVEKATRWYEKREVGLGDRLIDEIRTAVGTLQNDADIPERINR
jgi:plasmid stabilization system protein ParE